MQFERRRWNALMKCLGIEFFGSCSMNEQIEHIFSSRFLHKNQVKIRHDDFVFEQKKV